MPMFVVMWLCLVELRMLVSWCHTELQGLVRVGGLEDLSVLDPARSKLNLSGYPWMIMNDIWMIYNDLILHHMDAKYDPNIGWWTRTEIVWAASASSTLLRDAGSPGTCTAAAVPTRTWVLSAPGQSATPRARRPGHAAFDATGFVQLE